MPKQLLKQLFYSVKDEKETDSGKTLSVESSSLPRNEKQFLPYNKQETSSHMATSGNAMQHQADVASSHTSPRKGKTA